jgi:hypothetical protein
MRKQQRVGTKYDSRLDAAIDANQQDLVDEVTTPHSYQLDEWVCCGGHKICSSVPAYNVEAQPTQARGGIVWNKSYSFQAHGPSYLDPIPDPDSLTQAQ